MIAGPEAAVRLATAVTCSAAAVVLLIHVPGLQAPFLVPKTAALELAAALALAAFALQRSLGGVAPGWDRPIAWGAALVLLTTVVSWVVAARTPEGAPYAAAALARWAALLGLACGASVVAWDADARQRLLESVIGAAAVVSLIGLWQHLELAPLPIPVISAPGSTFGNRNLAAEAVALSLPLGAGALLGARGRGMRSLLVVALGLVLVYLAATRTRGAWLGGALGLVTFFALARPRLSRPVLAAVLAAAALAATAALLPGRPNPRHVGDSKRFAGGVDVAQATFDIHAPSLRTRLGLWRRTLAMVGDHPFVGVGPGNWPVFFPRYAEPGAARDGVQTLALAPRQAHNDLLERTAETGGLGLASLLILGAALVLAIRRRLRAGDQDARTATAAAAGALVALVAAGITGFPLEMPATLAIGGLALGLMAPGPDQVAGRWGHPHLRRATAIAVSLAAVAWAGLRAERHLRGNHWLGQAERLVHGDPGPRGADRALSALERARAATPGELRVHLRTAQMLLRLDRGPGAALAARRALALEPFSPNAWITLASAQLAARDVEGARASIERAHALLHDQPLALFVDVRAALAAGDLRGAASARARLRAVAVASTDNQATASAARELVAQLPDVLRPAPPPEHP